MKWAEHKIYTNEAQNKLYKPLKSRTISWISNVLVYRCRTPSDLLKTRHYLITDKLNISHLIDNYLLENCKHPRQAQPYITHFQ